MICDLLLYIVILDKSACNMISVSAVFIPTQELIHSQLVTDA